MNRITLATVASKTAMLDVACSRCDRKGRLSVARLLGEHGADTAMPDLKDLIAHDCLRIQPYLVSATPSSHKFPY